MTAKFRRPPINELVIGLYFERALPVRSEHIGLFWGGLRDEFPKIRQQVNVSAPATSVSNVFAFEITGENEVYPMPRFWLESSDESTLIQIQKNAFLFNWRKREGEYPHYDNVKATFDQNYLKYSRFLQKEFGVVPSVQIAELTYINVIPAGDYWKSPADTANIFPAFRLPVAREGETEEPDFQQATVQRFADDLTITTSIRNGKMIDNLAPALIFEYRALGLLGSADKAEADDWFGRAHAMIGKQFLAMTSPSIQSEQWQRIENGV